MVRFSVGLDLGSQQVALAVYDYARKCSVPLEVDNNKTMAACVAVEGGQASVIVGKRAEGRSAKKCEGVLCAHREMLYGMHEEWKAHRSMCDQQWHFSVSEAGASNNGNSPERNASSQQPHATKRMDGQLGSSYMIKGHPISVAEVIQHLVEVVCTTLAEAASPGGVLQVGGGEEVEWVNFAVAVPECITDAQRRIVLDAVRSGAMGLARSGQRERGDDSDANKDKKVDIDVLLVNDSLAIALQFCSIPPYAPKAFMSVDLGASKLTVSLYELVAAAGSGSASDSGGAGEADVGVGAGVAYVLKEIGSRSHVFVSGSQVEYRMMLWCEKHKNFASSMLSSKPALYKLRKEVCVNPKP
jgi:hypothetical protein